MRFAAVCCAVLVAGCDDECPTIADGPAALIEQDPPSDDGLDWSPEQTVTVVEERAATASELAERPADRMLFLDAEVGRILIRYSPTDAKFVAPVRAGETLTLLTSSFPFEETGIALIEPDGTLLWNLGAPISDRLKVRGGESICSYSDSCATRTRKAVIASLEGGDKVNLAPGESTRIRGGGNEGELAVFEWTEVEDVSCTDIFGFGVVAFARIRP